MVDPLRDAYAHCERLARQHYENFPVASRLLPAAMRPHIAAIYAFARVADDFADEAGIPDTERLRLLDEWEALLHRRSIKGRRPTDDGVDWGFRLRPPDTTAAGFGETAGALAKAVMPRQTEAIFVALHNTITTHQLPLELFQDLLSAFRQDVTTHRYETWAEVLDYCRRSANPVGRLVLRVAGYTDARLDAASDATCTALQLTNFWQDLDRDWRAGRLYVPRDARDIAAAREEDLTARHMTPEWRAVLADVAAQTRELFDRGREICDGVHGRLRWELRMTWLGGRRILDKLERSGFDVFHNRPTLGAADVPLLIWQAITWTQANAQHANAQLPNKKTTNPQTAKRPTTND